LLLVESGGIGEKIVHVEGPRRYSACDVAAAFSQLLGREVTAQALPRSQWLESLGRVVSPSTANLLTALYDAHNKGGLVDVEPDIGEVRYGRTEMIEALRPFIPSR
jgi:NAD(P)H dehydrogenase (quinone)